MEQSKPFAWPAGCRAAVSLTFDDARPSQVDRGLPVLDTHGVKATFYVSPRRVEERLAGWRQAVADGHEIGNHTLTHPCSGNFPWSRQNALEDYTLERIETEILNANAECERLLGVTPATFAYPCGQSFVGRGEGLRSYVPLVARHFVVGRAAFNEIPNDPAFTDLAQVTGMDADGKSLEQLEAMVDRTVAAGGWLILFGHEVGDGGFQTTRADALDALCRRCKEPGSGVWIDTVKSIGTHVRERQRA